MSDAKTAAQALSVTLANIDTGPTNVPEYMHVLVGESMWEHISMDNQRAVRRIVARVEEWASMVPLSEGERTAVYMRCDDVRDAVRY